MSYNEDIKKMMVAYGQSTPTEIQDLKGGHVVPSDIHKTVVSLKAYSDELLQPHDSDSEIDKLRKLRISLLIEEFCEYIYAERDNNIVEIADALGDMKVIIEGTAISYGIPLEAVDQEILGSNMSKVTQDGTVLRREDGKVLKPEGYYPPNLAKIIHPTEENN